jgi:hypothetical protein
MPFLLFSYNRDSFAYDYKKGKLASTVLKRAPAQRSIHRRLKKPEDLYQGRQNNQGWWGSKLNC